MDIKNYTIDTEYFITELPNFEEFKKEIEVITDNIPSLPIKDSYETIDYTDWSVPYKMKPYYEVAVKYLTPFLEGMAEKLYCKYYSVHEFWYQRYKENDFQKWHNHVGCMYTNVLFLDLESPSFATEIADLSNNKVLKFDNLTEGKIISFPAHILHRAPKITHGKKTVLAFNTSYFDIKRSELSNVFK
jgi:hypothetical protein